MITTVEHLDRCATCRRRTLHRRTVQRDPDGLVIADVRTCVFCANRAASDPSTNPAQVMKEARSLKRRLRDEPYKKRARPPRSA